MMKRTTTVLLFLAAFAAALFAGSGNVFSASNPYAIICGYIGSNYCLPGSDELHDKRCFRSPEGYVILVDDSITEQMAGNPNYATVAWPVITSAEGGGWNAQYNYIVCSTGDGSFTVQEIDILPHICDGVTIDPSTATETDTSVEGGWQYVANGAAQYTVITSCGLCPGEGYSYPCQCTTPFGFSVNTISQAGTGVTGIDCNEFMQGWDSSWSSTFGYIRGPGCFTALTNQSKQFTASTGAVIQVTYFACSQRAQSVKDITNNVTWNAVPAPYIAQATSLTDAQNNAQQVQAFGGPGGTLVETESGDIYLVIGSIWYTSCTTCEKYNSSCTCGCGCY